MEDSSKGPPKTGDRPRRNEWEGIFLSKEEEPLFLALTELCRLDFWPFCPSHEAHEGGKRKTTTREAYCHLARNSGYFPAFLFAVDIPLLGSQCLFLCAVILLLCLSPSISDVLITRHYTKGRPGNKAREGDDRRQRLKGRKRPNWGGGSRARDGRRGVTLRLISWLAAH